MIARMTGAGVSGDDRAADDGAGVSGSLSSAP